MQDSDSTTRARGRLTALQAEFEPGELSGAWEVWAGVSGLLYARRRQTSPPPVFRGFTVTELARQIRGWEAASR